MPNGGCLAAPSPGGDAKRRSLPDPRVDIGPKPAHGGLMICRFYSGLLAMLLACTSPLLAAETMPEMFRDLQKKAQLHLIIETLDVNTEPLALSLGQDISVPAVRGQAITVKAKVLRVLRGSGVKPGQVITIRYDYKPKPAGNPAAPAPIPVLAGGIKRQAWLNRESGGGFVPAAFAYSFNAVPDNLPITGGPVAN